MSETETTKPTHEPELMQVFKGAIKEKFISGVDDKGRQIKQLVGIAIDGSVHSKRAFDCKKCYLFLGYLQEMHKETNKIAFIHILSVPDVDIGELILTGKWQESAKEEFKKSQEIINSYRKICDEKNIHFGSKQKHKIGAEVVRIVEDRGITWLIVGTRGLDTIRRTILGSVSDFLLHHSPIPITIVPPP